MAACNGAPHFTELYLNAKAVPLCAHQAPGNALFGALGWSQESIPFTNVRCKLNNDNALWRLRLPANAVPFEERQNADGCAFAAVP